MLIQDEGVRIASQPIEPSPSEAVGFSIRTDPPRGRGRDDHPDCSHLVYHCKKSGHGVATCFELIGYPPHWHDTAGRGCGRSAGCGRGTPARANVSASLGSPSKYPSSSAGPLSTLFSADE